MKDIYELPEPPQINYDCCSIGFNAYNMETDEYEIKVFSFLELALMICPNGKGLVLHTFSYPYEDKDTGRSERTIETEVASSDFLKEIYSDKKGELDMTDEEKQSYQNELQSCIIQKLDRIYYEKTNSVTC